MSLQSGMACGKITVSKIKNRQGVGLPVHNI